MTGLLQYSVAFVLIALFSIGVIGFAVNFAIDNNSAVSLIDDPTINAFNTKIEGNLSSNKDGSESTYQSIVDSSISEGDTTPTGGQFAITPVTAISIITGIVDLAMEKIFGDSFKVFGYTFLSIVLLIFGLYIWKAWAGRTPD